MNALRLTKWSGRLRWAAMMQHGGGRSHERDAAEGARSRFLALSASAGRNHMFKAAVAKARGLGLGYAAVLVKTNCSVTVP